MDKELAIAKAQNLKLQTNNKHLVAKSVETSEAIIKVEVLQHEYNELNQVHFKNYNDFKVLHIDFD
jgi:hypothetical protein